MLLELDAEPLLHADHGFSIEILDTFNGLVLQHNQGTQRIDLEVGLSRDRIVCIWVNFAYNDCVCDLFEDAAASRAGCVKDAWCDRGAASVNILKKV